MRPSVIEKYKTLCAAIGLAPNSYICKGLERLVLHVKVEKIQPEEWKPIIKCLENNSSLIEIILEMTNPSNCVYIKRSTKPMLNISVKNLLFKSLSSCLMCSSAIQKLSIINIPLKKTQIELFSRGLSKNQSLEFVNLTGSILGHKSFNELFPTIRKSLNITHLDFTQCKLSDKSCSLIGCLLRSQILERHTETWKHTLRYNNPDVTAVPGVKRITLNGNPIGDDGCEIITTALQDDYWVRAIDLQQCNISDEGAKMFLVMLEDNASLYALDMRLNPDIKDETLLKKIMESLERNKEHGSEGFENGDLLDCKTTPKPKKNVRRSISNINMRNTLNESRTPKKFSQYENYYNSMLKNSVVKNMECLNDISLHEDKDKFSPILVHRAPPPVRKSSVTKREEENQIFAMLDELKNDLEVYKRELYLEKEKTKVLESKIHSLERENLFLKNKQHNWTSELEPELLETIETSFSQFHNFLDMLKQAGYGELCQLVNK